MFTSFLPPYHNGEELSHAVLHNGQPVRAAGYATVEFRDDGTPYISGVNRHSGHYQPDAGAAKVGADDMRRNGAYVDEQGITETYNP